MHVLEFSYISFPYVGSRVPPNNDAIQKYFVDNKEEILRHFKDVFKIEDVFQFGITNLHLFDISILKNTKGKEKIVIKSKNNQQSALLLFEMLINLAGNPKEEVDYIKSIYFHLNDSNELYYFYKKIRTITGDKIANVIFNTWKNLGDEKLKPKFQKLSEYASQGAIMCVEGVDIFDKVHYKTELNNKVAINNQSKVEIKEILAEIEGHFNY